MPEFLRRILQYLGQVFRLSPSKPSGATSSWESHIPSEAAPSSESSTPPPASISKPDSNLGSYQPRFSEFIALLHHETQQVIEHLAQPELRRILQQAPSASFVKIERMHIDVPVRLLTQLTKLSKEELLKLPILYKPFLLPDGLSLFMKVLVLEPKTSETTREESKLRVEFSVAAK